MINEIKSLIEEFFNKLSINIESLEVTNEENSNIYNIIINSNESGILIWQNGKNLDNIQSILRLMISTKVWEKIKLHMEINDYIKSRDDRLLDFIKSKISYVKSSKKDFRLPFYSAYDRKKIHWFISDLKDPMIYTKSIWEWKERRLNICFQERKLSIDIDWDDI